MTRADLTTASWRKLRRLVLDRDGWRCTSCGKPIEGPDATVDHVVPFVSESESNVMHNLVSLCRSCNSTKQDRVTFRLNWANPKWLTHV